MDSQPKFTGHIFISYAREDQTYTRKLADSLRQRGFEVWMDERLESGDRWLRTIEQAVRDSAAFVVVMTPESGDSKWVEREILLAESEGKPIFPLLLRGRVFFLLINTQYDDVTGGRMPPGDFYERLEREVRPRSGVTVAPLAPEPTVPKERGWQRLGLPLAVVVLLGLVIAVVVIGLVGGGGQPPGIPKTSLFAEVIPPTTETAAVTVTPRSPNPTPSETHAPTETATITPSPTPTLGIGSILVREKDGMEMVYVPGGTFQMGSTDEDIDAVLAEWDGGGRKEYEHEQPQHQVALSRFWIDQTEVTNAQYTLCVTDGVCRKSSFADDATLNGGNYPVVGVSWDDAAKYCQWAGGRLPTEAEWEYAARGAHRFNYPWGNEFDCRRGNFDDETREDGFVGPGGIGCDGYERTAPVGSFPGGASWCEALDMSGNVWEWEIDWYDSNYYAVSQAENPTGPDVGTSKVLRGGSWFYGPIGARAAFRRNRTLSDRDYAYGFRCVVEPSD